MNCVQALLDAANREPASDKRYTILAAAGLLEEAIANFNAQPTLDNLRDLNGVWAYCFRVLGLATPAPEPTQAVA